MGLAATLSAAVLSVASPSKAFLGIGEDIQQQYTDQTVGGPREGVELEGQDACGMHAVHACMHPATVYTGANGGWTEGLGWDETHACMYASSA